METIRIWYRKIGECKYISHLDINRCMQRVLRLSGLPIWYTQGFNPHLYTTFALPTAIFFESDCEAMDMRLEEHIEEDKVVEALNRVFPRGLRVFKASYQFSDASEIAFCRFRISLIPIDGEDAPKLLEDFRAFLSQEKILTVKKTKKGPKEIDLRPAIDAEEITLTEEDGSPAVHIQMVLPAGSNENINPTLLLDAFTSAYGHPDTVRRIRKCQILKANKEIFE